MSTLKFKPLRSIKILAASLAAIGVLGAAHSACAYPTTSPSAVAAVRLKYRPPANWIRHYLGDDRYKIAGNIWKFVSTTTDQYYHRADSPFMLSQPAGIVIGFSSAEEAEEAGYLPGPSVGATVLPAGGGSGNSGAGGNGTVNPSVGIRIVLADGVSSVILPAGWRVLQSKRFPDTANSIATNLTSDLLIYGNNADQGLLIMTSVAPRSINLQREMSATAIRRNIAKALKNPNIDQSVKELLSKSKIRPFRLGGLPGYIQHDADTQHTSSTVSIISSRGQKLYWFQMAGTAESAPGLSTIVNSFQPR